MKFSLSFLNLSKTCLFLLSLPLLSSFILWISSFNYFFSASCLFLLFSSYSLYFCSKYFFYCLSFDFSSSLYYSKEYISFSFSNLKISWSLLAYSRLVIILYLIAPILSVSFLNFSLSLFKSVSLSA